MSNLSNTTMTTKELLALYNTTAEKLGEKTVKRFSDRKSAIRRTEEILKKSGPTPTKPTTKKKREMHFTFKPGPDGIRQVKNSDSLRGQAVTLLKTKGATLEQIKTLIKGFDHDRGKGNAATIDRRAYELVRIMHYYLGYGIRKNDDGVITIYVN